MPFAYYRRLSARQRRIYDQSEAIVRVDLPHPARFHGVIDALCRNLRAENRKASESTAQELADSMFGALKVSRVRVRVLAARPSHDWGELHGLYEPQKRGAAVITVWMRTAQRRQVVAFKTFLRTLLHEFMHHLDYEHLHLDDSYHTQGFYKRESSLFRQLVPDPSRYEPIPASVQAGTSKSSTTKRSPTKALEPATKPTRAAPTASVPRTPGVSRTASVSPAPSVSRTSRAPRTPSPATAAVGSEPRAPKVRRPTRFPAEPRMEQAELPFGES